MAQSFEITIGRTGEIKVEAQGFTGTDCQKGSEALEALLGDVQSRELKPEFYQQPVVVTQFVQQ